MIEKSDIEALERLASVELDETEYVLTAERLSKLISKASKLKLIDTSQVAPTSGSLNNVYDDQAPADVVIMFKNEYETEEVAEH